MIFMELESCRIVLLSCRKVIESCCATRLKHSAMMLSIRRCRLESRRRVDVKREWRWERQVRSGDGVVVATEGAERVGVVDELGLVEAADLRPPMTRRQASMASERWMTCLTQLCSPTNWTCRSRSGKPTSANERIFWTRC
jgi:hypothetical protein